MLAPGLARPPRRRLGVREDLLALLETGAVQLVEALPVDAFAAEHIPGARNVPGQVSAEQVAPDRAAMVVVYRSGP
ncbi:rhodanese-like domain-containing protein [Nonomuraea sp. NPDC049695]|uniref:rhodanese-like domain-containing protein n=1 Tax=Nonomuraea sp. NPDC049695 TaxID=3154734 RepID=UPI0034216E12